MDASPGKKFGKISEMELSILFIFRMRESEAQEVLLAVVQQKFERAPAKD